MVLLIIIYRYANENLKKYMKVVSNKLIFPNNVVKLKYKNQMKGDIMSEKSIISYDEALKLLKSTDNDQVYKREVFNEYGNFIYPTEINTKVKNSYGSKFIGRFDFDEKINKIFSDNHK